MKSPVLTVADLRVRVGDKEVLKGGRLEISGGEVGAVVGANGSGKTTLTRVLLGDPSCEVEGGKVELGGNNLLQLEASERARAGLFVAWQNPVAVPGVSVFALAKALRQARGKQDKLVELKQKLEQLAETVGLTPEHVGRSVNEGFSGGEKKRLELLWMILSEPKVAILDEVDSGLDEKGRKLVAQVVQQLQKAGTAVIVITHYSKMLEQLKVNKVWTIHNGRIQVRS